MRADSVPHMHYHNINRASPFRTPYKVTYIIPSLNKMWVKVYYVLSEDNLKEVIEACKKQVSGYFHLQADERETFIAAYAPLGVLEQARLEKNSQVYGNQQHKMWQSGHGSHKHMETMREYVSCDICTDL